jgi:hypothetical protein
MCIRMYIKRREHTEEPTLFKPLINENTVDIQNIVNMLVTRHEIWIEN